MAREDNHKRNYNHNDNLASSVEIRHRAEKKNVQNKLKFFMFGVVIFYTALTLKLIHTAGMNEAEAVYIANKKSSERSQILDRNGIAIAMNLKTKSLSANPRKMMDKKLAAKKLHSIFPDLNEQRIFDKVNNNRKHVWIKRALTPKEQDMVQQLGIPGLQFENQYKRVYPQGNLFSHTVGYTNIDMQGLGGIERSFNNKLHSGQEDLSLSLDVRLQHLVKSELETAINKYKALGATAIVAEVKTGEVLSMVSLPDFDPHKPAEANKKENINKLTLGLFELGSVLKPITAAIALDKNLTHIDKKYDTRKPIRIAKYKIDDLHPKRRLLSLEEVISYSSNIGTVKLAQDIGVATHKDYLKKLGLLDKLDIEINEKSKPLFPKRWKEIDSAVISYGHGISISPMHVVQSYLPLLNDGYSIPLTLIKDKNQEVLAKRVLKPSTSANTRYLLTQTVEYGTAKGTNISGYNIGGKTGTADKIINGKYYRDQGKVIASFVGSFPMDDPKYIVLVTIDEPKAVGKIKQATGGTVAVPIFKKIISSMAGLYGIEADQNYADSTNSRTNISY